MNRIKLIYKLKSTNENELIVINDIKGFESYDIATSQNYYYSEADDLFKLLTNIDYKKIEDYMDYGVEIITYNARHFDKYNKEIIKYCKKRNYTIIKGEQK